MATNKRALSLATFFAAFLWAVAVQADQPEGSGWYLTGSIHKTRIEDADNKQVSETTTTGPLGPVTTTTMREFKAEYDDYIAQLRQVAAAKLLAPHNLSQRMNGDSAPSGPEDLRRHSIQQRLQGLPPQAFAINAMDGLPKVSANRGRFP